MNPVVLHVIRPYDSEEEFLDAEAWTIEARAMLLLDQRQLENDTSVVFDVGLPNGVKMMRAEARVVGFIPSDDGAPSALKVRFRRYGSQTKAFIERAVQLRQEQLAREAQRPSSVPPAQDSSAQGARSAPPPRVPSVPPRHASAPPRAPSNPPPRVPSNPPARVPSNPPPRVPSNPPSHNNAGPPSSDALPAPPAIESPLDPGPVSSETAAGPATARSSALPLETDAARLERRIRPLQEPSGVHRRPISEVTPPRNRDELLDRLRARARKNEVSVPSKSGTN